MPPWTLLSVTGVTGTGVQKAGGNDPLVLNESFSADGAQEYAVVRDGRQIVSITVSWMSRAAAHNTLAWLLRGGGEDDASVRPTLDPAEDHHAPIGRIGPEKGEPRMPLTKYSANFPYAREELFALFAGAHAGDVEHGGRYEARGGVLHIWSHPWRTQALRDESTLVGRLYFNWLTDRLTQIEWDEGFELADLLHELALLEEHALGEVKHGQWRQG